MKLVAHSEVPKAIPYTHLGYLAAPGLPTGKTCGIIGLGLAVLIAMMVYIKRASGL